MKLFINAFFIISLGKDTKLGRTNRLIKNF